MKQKSRICRPLWALAVVLSQAACSGGTTVPESTLPAGVPISVRNPSFHANAQGGVADWRAVEHNGGQSYTFVADPDQPHTAPTSARIRRHGPEIFGVLEQEVRVDPAWFNKTVRLSGYLKTADAAGPGGALVLQARSSSGSVLAHDHMDDRRVKGNQGWKQYTAQLKIPPGTWSLQVGVMLEESGTLWADDIALELMD